MRRSRSGSKDAGMRVRKENAKKLLDGSKNFVIPYFQRAYVWDEEKWERFLEDIETIEDREYFMGFIVLKDESSSFDKEYAVIDGQQRLTTFYLFARALCEVNEDNFELVYFYPSDNDEKHPTLYHNHNDKPIFDLILADDPVDSRIEKTFAEQENKVLACYKYFIGQEDRIKKINLENVLEYLSFACMYLTEENDEQKIFDTMNSLGEPLRTSDLLKNELFSKRSILSKDSEEFYEQTWKVAFEKDGETKKYWDNEVITGRHNQTNLDILLRAYLEVKNPSSGAYKKNDTLFKRYKNFLNKPETNKEKFINELMEYAYEYRKHINPECLEKELDSNSFIQRLNIVIFGINITSVIPYILYILKEVESEHEQKEIFKVLESYLMRRVIAGVTIDFYNNYFMNHIASERNTCESLKEIIYGKEEADVIARMPSDEMVKEGFYNKKHRNSRAKIILYFLEHHANPAESSTAPLSPSAYSVEHVMPKSWEKNWKDNLPEIDDAKENRNIMLTRLGNLTLITAKLNSRISNAGWEVKKEGIEPQGKKRKMEGLRQCCRGLATFSDYLDAGDWDEDKITQRNDELFNLSKKLWKYDPPA